MDKHTDRESSMNRLFHAFARRSAIAMGSHWSFVIATALCLVWAASGPLFGYSDTWQLVINTATTVLTFLAVFLIQNTQNRDGLAIQLKLDELLRAVEKARTGLVNLEDCTDEELKQLQEEFQRLQKRERRKARADTASDDQPRHGAAHARTYEGPSSERVIASQKKRH